MAGHARTIRELLGQGRRSFSFEFFPPRGGGGEALLWRAVRELEPLRPTFVSVTYRAGTVRDRTTRIVERVARHTSLTAVAHLTCAGSSTDELRSVVRGYADAGVRNVLALRGDPPGGVDRPWGAHEEGLAHAVDLVRLLHAEGDFCVGVAAFPEGHPESPPTARPTSSASSPKSPPAPTSPSPSSSSTPMTTSASWTACAPPAATCP